MSGRPAVRGYVLALASVMLVTVAQLSLKLGMSRVPSLTVAELADWSVLAQPYMAWLALGLVCYFASLLLWIKVLGYLPLSMAYPVLSLSYVLVYVAATSVPALGELATTRHTAGIGFIVLGVVLVSWPVSRSRG